MKDIRIVDTNEHRINMAIKEAEGKATVRTIDYALMKQFLTEVERKYDISKRAMEGLYLKIDMNAQTFPKAYTYMPVSTIITVKYHNGAWVLHSISRDRTHMTNQAVIVITMPEATKQAIINRFCSFRV